MIRSALLSFLAGLLSLAPFAQEIPVVKSTEPRYGQDSIRCVGNLSLYRDLYTRKMLEAAYIPWKNVFLGCPAASENTYIDGAVILGQLIDQESDPQRRSRYIDTLMMVYDQRIKYFHKDGFVLGRKGVDLYLRDPSRKEEAYRIMKQSVEYEWRSSRPPVIVNLFLAGIQLMREHKLDTVTLYLLYDELRGIIDFNLRVNERDESVYRSARDTVQNYFNAISECDDLERIFIPQYRKDSADIDVLKGMVSAFQAKKCITSRFNLYLIKRIYEMDSTQEAALNTGIAFLSSSQAIRAMKYFTEATKGKDQKIAFTAYLYLAELHYKYSNTINVAKEMVSKAMEIEPESGLPYLLLGDIYSASAKGCGINEFVEKAVYWAAADQYNNAKKLDPGLAPQADELIEKCSRMFPSREAIFFQGLKEGDAYEINCWYNETTTVRAAP